jgi:hypothetical protein
MDSARCSWEHNCDLWLIPIYHTKACLLHISNFVQLASSLVHVVATYIRPQLRTSYCYILFVVGCLIIWNRLMWPWPLAPHIPRGSPILHVHMYAHTTSTYLSPLPTACSTSKTMLRLAGLIGIAFVRYLWSSAAMLQRGSGLQKNRQVTWL